MESFLCFLINTWYRSRGKCQSSQKSPNRPTAQAAPRPVQQAASPVGKGRRGAHPAASRNRSLTCSRPTQAVGRRPIWRFLRALAWSTLLTRAKSSFPAWEHMRSPGSIPDGGRVHCKNDPLKFRDMWISRMRLCGKALKDSLSSERWLLR